MEIASIIISLLALIIAGFTLWYTYKARIDAKIQTTELSKQNEILKAKNRIDILPELYIKNIGTYSVRIEDFLKFDINNKGENATLLSINVLSQNLKIISSPFPLDLNKGEQIYLHFIYTRNQYIEADEYYLELIWKDKANNKYKSLIKGNIKNLRIVESNPID